MADKRVITVEELETMSPQQRADAIDASIVHSWDEVDPGIRMQIEAAVARHSARRSES